MNSIHRINRINQQELDNDTKDTASWHMDYKDTNYIYIGGLNSKLKEKDIIIIFSQYGVPTHIKLIKDQENPDQNKGFGYLKYRDFESCVLAIDNFNGVIVYDKTIRVDHCWFKLRENEQEESYLINYEELLPKVKQIEGVSAKQKKEKVYQVKTDSKEKKYEEQAEEEPKTQEDKFGDPMNEFKDPIDEFKDPIDEFKDPMDEFKDPMEGFVKRRKTHDGKHKSYKRRHKK